MNALAFLFRPVGAAVVSTAHVLVLVLAVSWAPYAAGSRRPLAAVLLLAALGWPAKVAVSVWAATRPVGYGSAGAFFGWAPVLSHFPLWVAVAVGIGAAWRARRADPPPAPDRPRP